jgi:Cu-Zn family superoxide dismutase
MKKFAAGVLVGVILSSGMVYAASINVNTAPIKFFVNGVERVSSSGQTIIHNGRTYVSAKEVSGWLGQSIYWNKSTSAVSIGKPQVEIVDANGKKIGSATLTEEQNGVQINLKASHLTAGKHGFHIHEKAFTGADFKTAGGHFNPEGKKHGLENPDGHHMGDMENLEVKEDGTVTAEITVHNANLKKGTPNSLLGKSMIIHAKADDGKTDPSGNSGDRIAGGIIPE